MAKIAFLTFLLIIYTHIIGCAMWFSLKTEMLWVAPTDFGNIRSRLFDPWYETGYASDDIEQVMKQRVDFELFIYQWMSMWYHSALSLMLVDITARTLT